jgi:hypothetical protein
MDVLQAGITAARAGQRSEARALLKEALQANPHSEQGWLWMSAVVESDAERRVCLERVLSINPQNQTARAGLDKLRAAPAGQSEDLAYLPVSRPARPDLPSKTLDPGIRGGPPSPHSQPTVGLDATPAEARAIRRLEPLPEPSDGLAQLRATRFQAAPAPAEETSSAESDRFMALVLIGGLSVTALAGGLMLVILLIIGWPP